MSLSAPMALVAADCPSPPRPWRWSPRPGPVANNKLRSWGFREAAAVSAAAGCVLRCHQRRSACRAGASREHQDSDGTAALTVDRRRLSVSLTLAPLAIAAAPLATNAEPLATLTPETLKNAAGKVAIITGATSGVGLEAARVLAANGCDVYVTGRTLDKAQQAVADVATTATGKVVPLELNLASLASVRNFAGKWKSSIKRSVDILACNAGLALGQDQTEPQFTADGFELTVGTNHLGHFLLVNLMESTLSPTARVVVTASSVHNPATGDPGKQATLGDLSGLGKGMVDGGPFDAGKAYKDSKLCNVLFTLELAKRLKKKGSAVTANCFSPGLIPSKSFFRYQNQTFSSVFAFAADNLLKISETPRFGGETLVFMALDAQFSKKSGSFFSAIPPGKHQFVEDTPSEEARKEDEAAELWKRSASLVAL